MTQMGAQVFFVVAAVDNAVTVPVAALQQPGAHAAQSEADPAMADLSQGATGNAEPAASGNDADAAKPYFVGVLDAKGHPVRREFWIGVSNGVSAEVLDGLEPGEVVVLGRHESGQAAAAAAGGSRGNRSGVGRLF